jgi:hypothetical protein
MALASGPNFLDPGAGEAALVRVVGGEAALREAAVVARDPAGGGVSFLLTALAARSSDPPAAAAFLGAALRHFLTDSKSLPPSYSSPSFALATLPAAFYAPGGHREPTSDKDVLNTFTGSEVANADPGDAGPAGLKLARSECLLAAAACAALASKYGRAEFLCGEVDHRQKARALSLLCGLPAPPEPEAPAAGWEEVWGAALEGTSYHAAELLEHALNNFLRPPAPVAIEDFVSPPPPLIPPRLVPLLSRTVSLLGATPPPSATATGYALRLLTMAFSAPSPPLRAAIAGAAESLGGPPGCSTAVLLESYFKRAARAAEASEDLAVATSACLNLAAAAAGTSKLHAVHALVRKVLGRIYT